MIVRIDIRDNWLIDVIRASAVDGSNDDEHDLLVEVADSVYAALNDNGEDTTAIAALYERANNLEDLNEGTDP